MNTSYCIEYEFASSRASVRVFIQTHVSQYFAHWKSLRPTKTKVCSARPVWGSALAYPWWLVVARRGSDGRLGAVGDRRKRRAGAELRGDLRRTHRLRVPLHKLQQSRISSFPKYIQSLPQISSLSSRILLICGSNAISYPTIQYCTSTINSAVHATHQFFQ